MFDRLHVASSRPHKRVLANFDDRCITASFCDECNRKTNYSAILTTRLAAAVSKTTAAAAASTASIPGPFEAFASARPSLQETGWQQQREIEGD